MLFRIALRVSRNKNMRSETEHQIVHCVSSSRGQASVEYLTAYGWIFLIIFLAIAAAAYVGLVNPSTYVPEECNIQGDLECIDQYLSVDGNVTLLIKNNYPIDIDLTRSQLATGVDIECPVIHIPSGEIGKYRCFLNKNYAKGDKFGIKYRIFFEKEGGETGTYFSDVNTYIRAEKSIDVDLDCITQGAVDTCVFPEYYCGENNTNYQRHLGGVPAMTDAENIYTVGLRIPMGENEYAIEEFIQCCNIACKRMPLCNNGEDDDGDGCAGFQRGDLDCYRAEFSDKEANNAAGCHTCPPGYSCVFQQQCAGGIAMPDKGYPPYNCAPDQWGKVCCYFEVNPPET